MEDESIIKTSQVDVISHVTPNSGNIVASTLPLTCLALVTNVALVSLIDGCLPVSGHMSTWEDLHLGQVKL
jgi:hypothetical protein